MKPRLLTIDQAAARVGRSRRQVETWIAAGLRVHRRPDDPKRTRYIIEAELLAVYRRNLEKNPARRRPRHAHDDDLPGTTSQS